MNCSLTWSWNSVCQSIKTKRIFFHLINWRFCLFPVWIHSTWRHWNDIILNKENSTIDFNDKPDDLPQCFNNSIQTSNNDTNTNPSNQYEMRRDDLKKFATLSHANAEYTYSRQLTLTLNLTNRNMMTEFGWLEEKSLQEITDKQLNYTWWKINWSASMLQ